MRKIPTVFLRDEHDRSLVTDVVDPRAAWVLAGEGVATRKYDGTCVLFDGTHWWARREVKPGKTPPPSYREVDRDEVTGKTVGWEPIEQSGFVKAWREAVDFFDAYGSEPVPGTYELIGPKVQGNPERVDTHTLVRHAAAAILPEDLDARPRGTGRTYGYLFDRVFDVAARGWEGLVFHHPDGRMAKIKARDFGLTVTAEEDRA